MKLSELIDAEASLSQGEASLEISGLSADSRAVQPGFLFAALAGTLADGARFVPDAIARGAVVILADTDAVIDVADNIAIIRSDDPRRALALMAARFYGGQPETMVAITGTNGKTSVASFLQQIWAQLGHQAASLGTLGVSAPMGHKDLQHTTPDPVVLHEILRDLADDGVSYAALETSSHGLAQRRCDGVKFTAGAFTNISRDHLDYHESFEDYFAQKARLFTELLPKGAGAVICTGSPEADEMAKLADQSGLNVLTVGPEGEALKLLSSERQDAGQKLKIAAGAETFEVELPLVGDFQVSNVLAAAGLAMACGAKPADIMACVPRLEGPKGRLENVAKYNGAQVFIDYAHTPDAIETALDALRPYATGKLVIVFGCGGDRDKGKRKQMGAVAQAHSDLAIVTDDNPRNENPAAIRAEIMQACPEAQEIGDRRDAIAAGLDALGPGDVLLIAGKGHETGQIIGDQVMVFSDHDVVADLVGRAL